ncbi:MAG: HK97 family phage prohead protease [Muribaculaceae bacterium]|nr:HK97 family phage prohead protease [Muribaculaceae bacterium]
MSKNKRVRITNERLNSYGTRVLTAGMDVSQYERNPILLYMHQRGDVIGYVKDLKVEGDEVTGELMFDEATELSVRCKKQWEFGSLKMVSVGIDVLELSEDKKYLVEGQTSPTVTRSKLFEVSLVDIGANDDAIVLMKDGKRLEMGKDGENVLPKLNLHKNKEEDMDMKEIALLLGLPADASEEAIKAKINELKTAADERAELVKENDALKLSRIEAAVDGAISEKKITADKKEHFVELGKKVGLESLNATFGAMTPQVKLSQVLGHQGGAPAETTWQKLSDVPEDKILELRKNNPDEYKRLYKAEYGCDCEIKD